MSPPNAHCQNLAPLDSPSPSPGRATPELPAAAGLTSPLCFNFDLFIIYVEYCLPLIVHGFMADLFHAHISPCP